MILLFAILLANAQVKDGDLIFHKSQTQQSTALKEATGSEWTHVGIILNNKVVEETGGVKITAIKDFIARGKNHEYKVFRSPKFDSSMISSLNAAIKFYDKPYDIYFEFTDDREYCSEFVYKVFLKSTGIQIGTVQKMREMNLDGPYVKALIKQRLTDTGRTLNLDEDIITPISLMSDKDLIEVAP